MDSRDRNPFQHQGSLPVLEEHAKPVDKKQTRLLIETRGRNLRHFKSLEELLLVFHDAIDDHKRFYCRGILHCNVNASNIVILNSPEGDTIGRLIDLNHAKIIKCKNKIRTSVEDIHTEDKLRLKADTVRTILVEDASVFVDEATAAAALKAMGGIVEGIVYLKTLVERFKLKSSEKNPITLSDLRWDLPVENSPSVESYLAKDGISTGTSPYMSHKILREFPEVHNAIHDIESFFWVMIYMALTRASPGANNMDSPHTLVDLYFHAENPRALSHVKRFIFSTDNTVAKAAMAKLSNSFHNYFKDLKPFIENWQKAIISAYQFKAYERMTIHDYTKALIREAIAKLPTVASSELTCNEDVRQEAYQCDMQNAIQQNIPALSQQIITPVKADDL